MFLYKDHRFKKGEIMAPLTDLIEALHGKGFKATAQRIEILKMLSETRSHPTAEEVDHKVREKFPTISPATVYKTIQVLKEAGKVQELAFYDKKTRFDANMQPHINLVCLKCEKIEDIMGPKVKEFVQKFADKSDFKIEGQRIDYYGICRDCQKKIVPTKKRKGSY
jgi:Fur family peroxide stress response transcriptional regulator